LRAIRLTGFHLHQPVVETTGGLTIGDPEAKAYAI
jgi:hypothetical protein